MKKKDQWLDAIRQKLRPLLFELIVYSFFINILALVIPLFVLQVYNRVVAFGNVTTLQGLVAGVVLALMFDFVLRQIRSRLLQKAAMRIDMTLGESVVKKFWSLPLRELEARPGSYWQSLFRDVDMVRNTVAGPPFLLCIDLPFAILFVGLIFIIAEPIAWVFLSIIPIFILLAAVSGKLVGQASDTEKESQRTRDSLVGDMISSRSTVKSLSLDAGIGPHWENAHANNIETALKRGMKHDGFVNAGMVFTLATTVIITSFGALAIIDQKLSIGALIAANMLSNRVIGPFSQLVGTWKAFSAYSQSRERLRLFMDLATERTEQTISLGEPRGDLKLEDVSFGYEENSELVLEGLSAHFAPKTVHMIMGPNGGGKSTLIKLMKGLYLPGKGRVLLDGADLSQFTRAQLAKWIGYVPQETVLIDGTIRENITGKREYIPDNDVVDACRAAGVHDVITDLADGYGTNVGEAGHALSGGIRQRIAIARALIGNPPIMVFDEPSASLDKQGELQLKSLLQSLAQKSSVIVVSHSPVLLAVTQNLYLLDKHRILLSGPRDAVLKRINDHAEAASPTGNGVRSVIPKVGA
ncbi:MAG: peptidase domain-containing ABC transporter [Sneathiella sp.]